MKKYLLVLIFAFVIFSPPQSIAEQSIAEQSIVENDNANAILGTWLNTKQDGYIQIYKKTNNFDGVIVGGPNPKDANRVDINNPDPKMRSQLLVGMVMLNGFVYEGDNKWKGGQIYDPNNGKTYQCELELINQKKLSVRGYIGFPLFGRTEVWTRKQ